MFYLFHPSLYQGHETFNKFKIDEREKKLFSLCGPAKSESRARLYKVGQKFYSYRLRDPNS